MYTVLWVGESQTTQQGIYSRRREATALAVRLAKQEARRRDWDPARVDVVQDTPSTWMVGVPMGVPYALIERS